VRCRFAKLSSAFDSSFAGHRVSLEFSPPRGRASPIGAPKAIRTLVIFFNKSKRRFSHTRNSRCRDRTGWLPFRGRQVETEAAPIRYVAELLGADTDSERAIRWLIALMVFCCDPLAIALTAAASARVAPNCYLADKPVATAMIPNAIALTAAASARP
jgi:hypothetical protein